MRSDVNTIKYDPKTDTRDYNIFTEEFFSGADVAVYMDGEKVANLNGLQFSLQEQLKPLYGYASRTFDDVAIGSRIVVGSFRIALGNPTETSKYLNPLKPRLADNTLASPTFDITPSWVELVTPLRNFNISTEIDPSKDKRIYNSNDSLNALPSNNKVFSPNEPYSSPLTGSRSYTDYVDQVRKINNNYMLGDIGDQYTPPNIYSDIVMQAQIILKRLMYFKEEPNGFFNEETKNAISNFQLENGINIDGKLTQETMASLNVTQMDTIKPSSKYSFINKDNVSIKEKPFTESPDVVINISKGTKVIILDTTAEKWYLVQLPNNKRGYIPIIYVTESINQ